MSSEELKPCNEPQAHPDRCGCQPDAFQIARHSRRLVEQPRVRIAALEAERERLADALDRQSVITGDYIARCQRLADELAITRRVIDRIGQLCTTPHESKERFIRRVQSVIEWERAAQQEQPQ